MNSRDPRIPRAGQQEPRNPSESEGTLDLGASPPTVGLDGIESGPPASVFPVKDWPRYRFLAFLGEGGMGRVYKALDLQLHRTVALKFIRGDDPELSRRFLQEARAQARIDHPCVCKVHEVGEVEGKLYIAMQFIEGQTLGQIQREMSLDQKVLAMAQVAEAVHAAHREGLIHRDIKPGNVMVERTDGGFHPYVMDFGLARDQGEAGHTSTGVIVGTPWYMAPEQARGDVRLCDRRTDVYSLGATLYELLAGRAPFHEASGMDVLMKVLNEEPPPARKLAPSVPEDLDTIAMKCLEKEPARRYESARALAEDLRRYLDGEPIHARRASISYRLSKKARKHRAVVGVSAVALVAVLLLSGYGVRATWLARRQSVLAHRFGQEVKEMDSTMRYSAMLPLHDTFSEKAVVRERMVLIEEAMAKAGKAGEGPGHHALGRGCLALQDYAGARKHLQRAWDEGYTDPDVAQALGRALGALYQKEQADLERTGSRASQELARRELEKAYRDPALELLRRARGRSSIEGPEYDEALLAFYEKRYGQALPKLAEAIRRAPWLFEAYRLRGDIFLAQGGELRDAGDLDGAEGLLARAEEAYREAMDLARSDASSYGGLAEKWSVQIYLDTARGRSPESAFRQALAACADALKADPKGARTLNTESNAYKRWALYQQEHGIDPGEALERSVDAARRAIALDPNYAYAHLNVGVGYRMMAEEATRVGGDPRPLLEKALASFERAAELNPNFVHAHNNLGLAAFAMAQDAQARGSDPGPWPNLAERAFRKALAIDPRFAVALCNLGNLHLWLASEHAESEAEVDLALDSYEKAIAINANSIDALRGSARALALKGEAKRLRGVDPAPELQSAEKRARAALALKADAPQAWAVLAGASLCQAEYLRATGADPAPSLEAARKALAKAISIDPGEPYALEVRANLERFGPAPVRE